jgi:hypothetical protein
MALGGQTRSTNNPSCVPDDSSKCKAGEIPETRAAGDIDINKQVKCGKEPADKKKCDPSTQYIATEVQDNFDGTFTAAQTCKRTKKYSDKKAGKVSEVQPKKKAIWNTSDAQQQRQKRRDDEARRKADEEERVKKGQLQREEQLREQRRRPIKRGRVGYCLALAAFMEAGMSELGLKRSVDDAGTFNATLTILDKRDDAINEDDMHEWTTEYFDEDFIQSDDLADYWPEDAVFNDNIPTIDANVWVKIYVQKQEEHGKRDVLERNRLVDRDGLEDLFGEIAALFARLFARAGLSAAARFATRVAGASARVARILEKQPSRLFKFAQRGKGGTLQGMKNAAQKLKSNKYLKNCVETALPGI